ncbi:MAG: type II secretion system protein GspN [Nitrospirae bacterium RBG_13_39_12]|nr:MAG: type II secretion system protein GspN [Nitrospirae bacterium RBG_13_39_12]
MKKVLIALIAIPAFFWMLWIAFPKTSIESTIKDYINDKKSGAEMEGIRKGLFYSFSADSLKLNSSGNEQVSINGIHACINPLAMILFRMDVSFQGSIGGGDISGRINRRGNKMQIEINFENANIGEIAFFRIAGIQGTGNVSGEFSLIDGNGHVEFFTTDASFEPAIFSGVTVPLNYFHSVKGAMDIKGNIINVVSVAFEGKDIYSRMTGSIKDKVADLNMEIMPGKAFVENPLFNSLMEKYKISPGYYVIPLKGTIKS